MILPRLVLSTLFPGGHVKNSYRLRSGTSCVRVWGLEIFVHRSHRSRSLGATRTSFSGQFATPVVIFLADLYLLGQRTVLKKIARVYL